MKIGEIPKLGPAIDTSIEQAQRRLLACAQSGIFRHGVDEKYNGFGDSFLGLAKKHEELGQQTRDPGLILALNAHIWGSIFTVKKFGSETQKDTWLPLLLSGDVIAGHAITEPHAGSNIQAMTTRYRCLEEQIILTGHKRYITNTPIAKMMIVYAKEQDSEKISAFIVKPDDHGAQFLAEPTVTGCATASMGDIILSDCSIPKARLVGKAGAGATMIQLALELERAFIFSGILGIMEWQLKQAVDHAKNPDVTTVQLQQYQAITHKIAQMKLRLDTARLWVHRCANLLDSGKRITSASAQTKLYASEAFLQSSLDLVHIFGASGLTKELTALVNDAMAGRLMSGSSEIQKNIIAAMLGLQHRSNV